MAESADGELGSKVLRILGAAQAAAKKGVKADSDDDPVNAVKFYMQTVALLDGQFGAVPNELKPLVYDFSNRYKIRAEQLVASLPAELFGGARSKQKQAEGPDDFEELETPPVNEATLTPPSDASQKPFWLMQLLVNTMKSGGYVGRNLFVPHEVWYMPNVRLAALPTKFDILENLCENLHHLLEVKVEDMAVFSQELEDFAAHVSYLQNLLASSLRSGVPTVGKEHRIAKPARAVAKPENRRRKKTDESGDYTELLIRVLDMCSIFGDWNLRFEHLATTHSIRQSLARITNFIDVALCPWVLSDFSLLLETRLVQSSIRFVTFSHEMME